MFCFLLTLAAGALLSAVASESCNGCNAYKCIDAQTHCGPRGYPLGYGLKYCNRFFEPDVYNRYDNAGKKFIQCTKECLIGDLRKNVHAHPSESCNALEDYAFDTHVDCYTGCGFCDICKENKLALLHTYDVRDFFSKRALKQVFEVIKKCGIFRCL